MAAPWPRRWGPCLGRRDSHADQGAVATQFSSSTETGTSPWRQWDSSKGPQSTGPSQNAGGYHHSNCDRGRNWRGTAGWATTRRRSYLQHPFGWDRNVLGISVQRRVGGWIYVGPELGSLPHALAQRYPGEPLHGAS